jgi:hypothetical protein
MAVVWGDSNARCDVNEEAVACIGDTGAVFADPQDGAVAALTDHQARGFMLLPG